MRRICVLVSVCVIVLFGGCRGTAPAAEPVGEGFTCTVQATYRDMQVGGTLTRHGGGTLSLTFTAPETLRDLTATWDGENVTLRWHGLSFTVDPASVPESALGEELVAVWDAAARGDGEKTQNGNTVTLSGNGENGAYTLTCDAATGAPLALSVPSLPLDATFTDFQKQ